MDKNNLKVVLIGETGVGKSQLGNFILQNECFKIGNSKNSETEILSEGYSHLDGMNVTIVDTPGLNDTGSKDEEIMNLIVKKFQEDNSIDGIILVYSFRVPRRVQKHRELVNNLIKLFGKDLLKKRLKVIFTNSTVGEERDEDDEKKEREQMNDTKEFLNHIVTDNEMIFINSKKIFYNEFRSKIIELLTQIYDIKNKYGSINNALIKKKELEFIENEKQKEKERMEKELKRQKEEYEREQKKQKEEAERRQREFEKKMKEESERQKRELERKLKEESERRQRELEKQKKELEKKQREELEKLEKKKKENLEKKLKEIQDSINYYQSKISEKSNEIEEIKQIIKERNMKAPVVILSILAPLTLGLLGIGAGIAAYELKQAENQIKECEKDLENYKTEIEKLRVKEDALKLALI